MMAGSTLLWSYLTLLCLTIEIPVGSGTSINFKYGNMIPPLDYRMVQVGETLNITCIFSGPYSIVSWKLPDYLNISLREVGSKI